MRAIEIEKANDTTANYIKGAKDEPIVFMRDGQPYAALVSVDGLKRTEAGSHLEREVLRTMLKAIADHALEDEQAFEAEIAALSHNPVFLSILEQSRSSLREHGGIPIDELDLDHPGVVAEAGTSANGR